MNDSHIHGCGPDEVIAGLLVDAVIERYVDWREESAAVRAAYCCWAARVDADDAATSFAAYRATLDREECAASGYATAVNVLVRFLWSARDHGSDRTPLSAG